LLDREIFMAVILLAAIGVFYWWFNRQGSMDSAT